MKNYSRAANHFMDMFHDEVVVVRTYAQDGYEKPIKNIEDKKTRNFWLRQLNIPISYLSDVKRYRFLSVILGRNIESSEEATNVEASTLFAVFHSFPYITVLEVIEDIVDDN